ncbi:flagellar basal body-associated protein FliL [Sediminibacillus massiliensis]|uniref:flagellar basal body-associated protein FliL n=1 Tax=Sediminibacillus massiliensis TaxID=1926277 RepID=UPI0009885765|nr:flagellar basal body-associated protein FliL [Sediminibacillus massiliensis]
MTSKLMKTLVVFLVLLLVAAIAALVIILKVSGKEEASGEPTLDEVVENSFQTSEINTDLEDGSFVRIQFQVVTDSHDAKEEIEKREFQLQNILIKELASMNREDFKSGLSQLETAMKNKLNEVMLEGKVTDVYTINKVLQ